jgi:PAS domain S-box-containing protein
LISGADATLVDTVSESLASERFLRISAWCFRKDGSPFPASIAVNHFVSEKRRFFCFFIRDETLRTEAENQLRTIQNAVHNAGTGIAVAGLDRKILYSNPAFATLCGVASPADLADRTLENLFGDADLCTSMMETVQNGLSAMVEIPLHLPDGQLRWVQISTAPNFDSENALIGMVLSLVDIGDRRRAEQAERVVERDRVMMESLGAVCHHLGQPATVLLSSLEMISRMKEPDPAVTNELLQMSLEAAGIIRPSRIRVLRRSIPRTLWRFKHHPWMHNFRHRWRMKAKKASPYNFGFIHDGARRIFRVAHGVDRRGTCGFSERAGLRKSRLFENKRHNISVDVGHGVQYCIANDTWRHGRVRTKVGFVRCKCVKDGFDGESLVPVRGW